MVLGEEHKVKSLLEDVLFLKAPSDDWLSFAEHPFSRGKLSFVKFACFPWGEKLFLGLSLCSLGDFRFLGEFLSLGVVRFPLSAADLQAIFHEDFFSQAV